MNKIMKITIGAALGVGAIAGSGLLYYLSKMMPAKEERVSFRKREIIETIGNQLDGMDAGKIRLKSHLIEQKSIKEIINAIKNKELTYEELVAYYLLNIKMIDQSEMGYNAVSEVNPKAIEEARKYDQTKEDFPLKGIPILVKENINTNNMPTSSGTYALKDFIPQSDAEMIKELKENGVIILGKTNLSELSNFMSFKNPSGYSAKKGQTHNPFHPLKISPLGSSAGSAVAMATDLSTASIGTETSGSIIAPSAINSVVGYKPTRDSISAEGVIPITKSLDTVGVITKTVKDAFNIYNASTRKKLDILFDKEYIKRKRIGIWKGDKQFRLKIEEQLVRREAIVVYLEKIDTSKIDALFILKNDFERDLNAYLKEYNAPIQSLEELIEYNKKDPKVRMRYGQSLLEDSLGFKYDDEKVKGMVTLAQNILDKVMDENNLDAIVYKDNEGVLLTAVAGAPEITIPFGVDKKPIGATFSAKREEDVNLLKIAYSFEQNTKMRVLPKK